jgi:hypothetical protein
MVPQPLPAFDESEIPDQAILAAAHASQPAIPKTPHGASMHCAAIPSILDESAKALQRGNQFATAQEVISVSRRRFRELVEWPR